MDFTEQDKISVWQKGQVCQNNDPRYWRKDACNAWIGFQFYGNRDSEYGWEIDHIIPNGSNMLFNLQPLHWMNNAKKGDGTLMCPVTSNGIKNIKRY